VIGKPDDDVKLGSFVSDCKLVRVSHTPYQDIYRLWFLGKQSIGAAVGLALPD